MLSPLLAGILAALGLIAHALNNKDFSLPTHWRQGGLGIIGVAAMWLLWWKAGIPFFQWEAGQFNWGVFFLAWLVPVFLERIPIEGRKR